jgi:hypothetical protein
VRDDGVIFIGLDTSKLKISVVVANGERNGEVRFFGDISSEPASVASMVNKLSKRAAKLHFCYEAGPTCYGLYRQIIELGHECVVVAPSLVPKRAGDRVKTNRRDAVSLARLHRAGELIPVWVPDEGHEATHDDDVQATDLIQGGLRSRRPSDSLRAVKPEFQKKGISKARSHGDEESVCFGWSCAVKASRSPATYQRQR